MASQIDIFPTLCELMKLPPPEWLQGVSLMPVLNGKCDCVRDELYTEVSYHCNYEPQRAIRTSRYVFIRRYVDMDTVFCANSDEGYTKSLWVHHGWQDRTVDAEQLYDLMFDPMEMNNLALDSRYKNILEDMRTRLDKWLIATNDPIVNGKITNYTTNTANGSVYVSEDKDIYTYDLWGRIPQPEGYA